MRAIPVLKLTRSPQGLASIERLLRLRDDLMTAVTIGIGSLELEEGGTIPDCQLAVATHGTLNAAKDNAILVLSRFSGTSRIAEQLLLLIARPRSVYGRFGRAAPN